MVTLWPAVSGRSSPSFLKTAGCLSSVLIEACRLGLRVQLVNDAAAEGQAKDAPKGGCTKNQVRQQIRLSECFCTMPVVLLSSTAALQKVSAQACRSCKCVHNADAHAREAPKAWYNAPIGESICRKLHWRPTAVVGGPCVHPFTGCPSPAAVQPDNTWMCIIAGMALAASCE